MFLSMKLTERLKRGKFELIHVFIYSAVNYLLFVLANPSLANKFYFLEYLFTCISYTVAHGVVFVMLLGPYRAKMSQSQFFSAVLSTVFIASHICMAIFILFAKLSNQSVGDYLNLMFFGDIIFRILQCALFVNLPLVVFKYKRSCLERIFSVEGKIESRILLNPEDFVGYDRPIELKGEKGEELIKVKAGDIVFVKSSGHHVLICFFDRKVGKLNSKMLRLALSAVERKIMDIENLVKINRSVIVNAEMVEYLEQKNSEAVIGVMGQKFIFRVTNVGGMLLQTILSKRTLSLER